MKKTLVYSIVISSVILTGCSLTKKEEKEITASDAMEIRKQIEENMKKDSYKEKIKVESNNQFEMESRELKIKGSYLSAVERVVPEKEEIYNQIDEAYDGREYQVPRGGISFVPVYVYSSSDEGTMRTKLVGLVVNGTDEKVRNISGSIEDTELPTTPVISTGIHRFKIGEEETGVVLKPDEATYVTITLDKYLEVSNMLIDSENIEVPFSYLYEVVEDE